MEDAINDALSAMEIQLQNFAPIFVLNTLNCFMAITLLLLVCLAVQVRLTVIQITISV